MTAVLLMLAVVKESLTTDEYPWHAARCGFAILNRVTTYSVEFDRWHRPKWTPSEQVWLSFYDVLPIPLGGMLTGCVCPGPVFISRGWWTVIDLRRITACDAGWLLESDGWSVETPLLFWIESGYDVEMRWRKLFLPLAKP